MTLQRLLCWGIHFSGFHLDTRHVSGWRKVFPSRFSVFTIFTRKCRAKQSLSPVWSWSKTKKIMWWSCVQRTIQSGSSDFGTLLLLRQLRGDSSLQHRVNCAVSSIWQCFRVSPVRVRSVCVYVKSNLQGRTKKNCTKVHCTQSWRNRSCHKNHIHLVLFVYKRTAVNAASSASTAQVVRDINCWDGSWTLLTCFNVWCSGECLFGWSELIHFPTHVFCFGKHLGFSFSLGKRFVWDKAPLAREEMRLLTEDKPGQHSHCPSFLLYLVTRIEFEWQQEKCSKAAFRFCTPQRSIADPSLVPCHFLATSKFPVHALSGKMGEGLSWELVAWSGNSTWALYPRCRWWICTALLCVKCRTFMGSWIASESDPLLNSFMLWVTTCDNPFWEKSLLAGCV